MGETDYPGIDYGRGITNVDPENGIRYGVIPMHDVLQAWCDSAELHYTAGCPKCGNELDTEQLTGDYRFPCPHCGEEITEDDMYGESPDYESIDDGEYHATCSDGGGDIFITKSPYYTYAQFCSPCAPGAGYLRNPCPEGPKTYCFGHDWFTDSDEPTPYPVYRVDNDQLVPPPI